MVTGKTRIVHMEKMKPFFGSKEDAYKTALTDNDQKVIRIINA